MVDLPASLTDRTAFLLRLATNRAEAMGEQTLAGLGLSGREYGILTLLQAGSPPAQHQLGAALGIDRTTTVAVLGALERRELITRATDPGNRRAHRVVLTATGERLRAAAAALLADCDDRFLQPVAPRDRATLRRILQRLV